MKHLSFHTTKMLALVISASGILLSASMAHAEEPLRLSHRVNPTICQTMHASKAQAKYTPSGVLFNDDENNVLKVVCPLPLAADPGTSRLSTIGVYYTQGNPTKALRCRVGSRDFLGRENLRTPYQTVPVMDTNIMFFAGSQLDSILQQNGFLYLYCEIPQKTGSLSSISGIKWYEHGQ